MISKNQIKTCKSILLERQNHLINQIQDHYGLKLEMAQESAGELSNYDNHPADTGTELFERSKDIALNEHAETELQEINEALHAIEDGTYAICTKCGRDIPFERLEAIPTTDRCIEHAKDDLDKKDRPLEEQVFSPNITSKDSALEDEVEYDAEDAWQEVSRYGTSETPSDFFGDKDNYDEMYPNSDENVGYSENIENFISADANGKYAGVTANHMKYKQALDDE